MGSRKKSRPISWHPSSLPVHRLFVFWSASHWMPRVLAPKANKIIGSNAGNNPWGYQSANSRIIRGDQPGLTQDRKPIREAHGHSCVTFIVSGVGEAVLFSEARPTSLEAPIQRLQKPKQRGPWKRVSMFQRSDRQQLGNVRKTSEQFTW